MSYLQTELAASERHADGWAEAHGAGLRLATHHAALVLLDANHVASGGGRVVQVPGVVKVELARVEDEKLPHGLFIDFNLLTTIRSLILVHDLP